MKFRASLLLLLLNAVKIAHTQRVPAKDHESRHYFAVESYLDPNELNKIHPDGGSIITTYSPENQAANL
mgnify:CR=1 FL=1